MKADDFRKLIIFGALAIAAVAAFKLMQNDWKPAIKLRNLVASTYEKFSSRDCPPVSKKIIPGNSHPISMLESTGLLGEDIVTKTFALSVSDINGDGKDDILIGAHNNNPYLYVSSGSGFTNESRTLFPEGFMLDRHGYTFADLDNDGDLDLAIASGGDDGVGTGAPNVFLKNDTESGVLHFRKERVSPDMVLPPGRSRSFIPIASPDGKAIDLYYATLARVGYPNRLFSNNRHKDKFKFKPEYNFFSMSVDDEGRGVIADYDGDGNNDYLVVQDQTLKLYWHSGSGREASVLSSSNAYSTTVADFNNDGRLDIFLGRYSFSTKSDNLAYASDEMIFVIQNNGPADSSSITFKSQSTKLDFNLDQYIPATRTRPFAGSKDIFFGSEKVNPESRIFTVSQEVAEGEPASFDQPGIYIWYSTSSALWNMKWIFFDSLEQFKGGVKGTGISSVSKSNFTINEPTLVKDAVFINEGNGKFSELCAALPPHTGTTSDSTVADFNNDGWLDIIGLHQQAQGSANGEIFVLTNNAGITFTPSFIDLREKDKLQRPDLIAHGFFNEDENPDIVITNGFGQLPGNQGSPRLMLNGITSGYQALLIDLEGTSSNKFAIGARLTLTDANDAIIGYRVQGLNSNIHQNTHWMHFGLGEYSAPYHLRVDWPDGKTTSQSFSKPGRYKVIQ